MLRQQKNQQRDDMEEETIHGEEGSTKELSPREDDDTFMDSDGDQDSGSR